MSEFYINNADIMDNNNNDDSGKKRPPSSKNKKKRGPMNILKVALHMLKNKKDGAKPSSKSVLSESTNTALTQIMGSVRPLYLQSSVGDASPSPPHPLSQPEYPKLSDEGVVTMMMSPESQATSHYAASTSRCSSSRSSSLGGGMSSKYASAQSLYDLDNHDDDDDAIIEEDDMMKDDGDAYYESLEGVCNFIDRVI
ncbi:hypothetical protein RND81_10G246800 [Saponaria officinalis]|uniref:Uncharacterized protein n=1 Tax=Saponaria officinalis TaxID=3572 RepID=A0AAW1I632_SAPOF